MIRVPLFALVNKQFTHVGFRDQTPAERDAAKAWRHDQLSIDIKRFYADANKRSDVRGFKEQQKFLRDKAWASGKPPVGELRGFTPSDRRRTIRQVEDVQVAA